MNPDDPLLNILACPLDKGPLHLLVPEEALYNPRLRRRYPLLDGIPQLLPSSGEQVADEEHERLLKRIDTMADASAISDVSAVSGAAAVSGASAVSGAAAVSDASAADGAGVAGGERVAGGGDGAVGSGEGRGSS